MDYGYLTLVAPILTLAVAIATRKVPLAKMCIRDSLLLACTVCVLRMNGLYIFSRRKSIANLQKFV